MLIYALLFAFSALVCVATIPLFKRLAVWCGQVDNPDGVRKTHAKPVPLAGGVAILVSSIVALVVMQCCGWSPIARGEEEWIFLSGLLASSVFICVLGIVDDRILLRGRHKLAGQLVAISLAIGSGVVVRRLNFFGEQVDLGVLAVPFTCAWLLGAINSINLIDGMDGLLGTIGLIICLTLAAMAIFMGQLTTAVVAVTLAGALVGFLCFNFPPASIFLGDAGSMLIGLVIGVLSIHSSLKGPAAVALTVPIAVMAIPFFDTFAAITRRKLTGKSIYFADREHLHHCLLRRGFSNRRTLLCVSCFCALTGAGAMIAVYLQNESFALFSVLATVAILVTTRLFGYSEFLLIKKHIAVAVASMLSQPTPLDHRAIEIRFHGSADWKRLWTRLADAGTEHELASLVLDVSAVGGKERYHARWASVRPNPESNDQWQADIPLSLSGSIAGRLQVVGKGQNLPMTKQLLMLADLIDDLESHLSELEPANHMPIDADGTSQQELVLADIVYSNSTPPQDAE